MTESCSDELCEVAAADDDDDAASISLSCYFHVDKLFRCLSGLLSAIIVHGSRFSALINEHDDDDDDDNGVTRYGELRHVPPPPLDFQRFHF